MKKEVSMRRTLKITISTILFLAVFCVIFKYSSAALVPNSVRTGLQGAELGAMWNEFYDLPHDSLDVAFYGSSNMFHGISPLTIWNEYGYTGFDLGSSTQRPWISYYFLQETLKTQKPKVVFIEMYGWLWSGPANSESHARNALDFTKPSLDKLKAIELTSPKNIFGDVYSYIWPILRYHSRWNQLTEDDFTYMGKSNLCKGQAIEYSQVPVSLANENDTVQFTVNSEVLQYYQKIVDLCKEKGINVVLFKTPTKDWRKTYSDQIKDFANKNKIDFIDFNYMMNQLGIDLNKDFHDDTHLNTAGAEKVSSYIGNYLNKKYKLSDKRNDPKFSNWDTAYVMYKQNYKDWQLSSETNFSSYLDKLKDKNYTILISKNGALNSPINQSDMNKFNQLGIQKLPSSANSVYSAIIQNGVSNEKEASYKNGTNLAVTVFAPNGKDKYYYQSSSSYDGDETISAKILVNGDNHTPAAKGLVISVYDTLTDKLIDTVSINYDGGWKLTRA